MAPTCHPASGRGNSLRSWSERHNLWAQPGKLKLLYWAHLGQAGHLSSMRLPRREPPVQRRQQQLSAAREPSDGVGLNLEQQITTDLGALARASVSQGVEVKSILPTSTSRSRRASPSLARAGARPDDTVGLALASSTASRIRPSSTSPPAAWAGSSATASCRMPAPSRYSKPITASPIQLRARATLDYQFVNNLSLQPRPWARPRSSARWFPRRVLSAGLGGVAGLGQPMARRSGDINGNLLPAVAAIGHAASKVVSCSWPPGVARSSHWSREEREAVDGIIEHPLISADEMAAEAWAAMSRPDLRQRCGCGGGCGSIFPSAPKRIFTRSRFCGGPGGWTKPMRWRQRRSRSIRTIPSCSCNSPGSRCSASAGTRR